MARMSQTIRRFKRQVKQSAFKYTMGFPMFWIAVVVVLSIFLILLGLNFFLKEI